MEAHHLDHLPFVICFARQGFIYLLVGRTRRCLSSIRTLFVIDKWSMMATIIDQRTPSLARRIEPPSSSFYLVTSEGCSWKLVAAFLLVIFPRGLFLACLLLLYPTGD
jgi:hypothetical protein